MKRTPWVWGALLFLGLFGAYLHTLNPAFRADDSPETIASCVTLGIQHPPGYPLHTLAGRVFSLLPVGSPAWRLNMMAAVCGALACALLAAAVWVMGGGGAGFVAGILLGLSPTFWSQSLAAKGGIYTFHAAQFAALMLLLALWDSDIAPRRARPQSSRLRLLQSPYFLLAAFLFFIGFGNHWETQALFVPALLAWLWLSLKEVQVDPRLGKGRGSYAPLIQAGLLALAGLSIYLYLPLRAMHEPVMNWGAPSTWKQFLWVLLRQEYLDLEVGFLKSLTAALTGSGPWSDVSSNWIYVSRQGSRVLSHLFGPKADLSLPAVALSVLGAWHLWKTRRPRLLGFPLILIASFAFVVTFYFHLKPEMIWIMDVFLIPAYMAQAFLAAWGLSHIVSRGWGEVRWAGAAAPALFAALFLLRLPAVSQALHYHAWDYGKNFLLSLRPKAIVLAEGDFNTMPLYYLRHVKGERKDLAHLTTIFLSIDWGVEQLKRRHPELGVTAVPKPNPNQRVGDGALLKQVLEEIIARNPHRPLQCSLFRQVQSENLSWAEAHMKPSGLTAEFRAPQGPAAERRRLGLAKAMVLRHLPEDRSRFDPSPEFALSNYGTLHMELANYLRAKGRAGEAEAHYRSAVDVTSLPNLAEAWVHWGIALAASGKLEQAVEKFSKALEVKPIFEAHANLAGTLNQLKRYAEAEVQARRAIQMQQASGLSWNNLAIAMYYQNRAAEAVKALETASALNPSDPTIQANLKALRGR